ncbi:MAG TPA: DUF3347 domain-containing protein [Thermoanaerobaculia bacterium]|nr:DUF3347 domain-containing protein [Thermoanaerobaculia bacterium]
MRNKFLAVFALLTLPVFANGTLFSKYETVRQALLKQKLADVQSSAKALAEEAKKAENVEVLKTAEAVSATKDLKAARTAFASLSNEMIKVRNATKGERPAIGFCPMVNKSWLQAKSQKVGNPYDPAMEVCGMIKE